MSYTYTYIHTFFFILFPYKPLQHLEWSFLCSLEIFISYLFYDSSVYEVKPLSRVRHFATPWTVAYKAPLSMEFSRQEVACICQSKPPSFSFPPGPLVTINLFQCPHAM